MSRLRRPHEHEDMTYVTLLAALAGFFLLWGLGRGSLASWDEAIYATVARDIVRTGDWFRLSMRGEPWADKPPLGIWATAAFHHIFGVGEFSSRLFSALAGVGTVLATYFLGRAMFGAWTGFLGAFVLLSSSHFFRSARFGMLDVPLTLFFTLAMLFYWLAREKNRWFVPFGIVFGLALLTKGFAAFLILPPVFLHAFLSREREVLGRSNFWIAMMIAVGIALPWFLFQAVAEREAFVRDVVVKHLFLRTTQAIEGHAGSWYFYIRTVINKYHPWVLVGIWAGPYFLFRAVKSRKPSFVFLASWMFSLLLIFTLVKTKLATYIIPAYPALSLAVAYFLAKWFKEEWKGRVMLVCAAALFLHVPFSRHFSDVDRAPDLKAIGPAVQEKTPADATVFLYNYHGQPESDFYLDRRSQYLDTPEELDAALAKPGPFYAVAFEKDLPSVNPEARGLERAASAANVTLLKRGGA